MKKTWRSADIAEDAGKIQFFLEDWRGGGGEVNLQFLRDDGREGGFAETRRTVQQHVVHGFAAFSRGFDSDRKVFLQLGLPGEIGQAARTKTGFDTAPLRAGDRWKPMAGRACATSLAYQLQRPAEERLELHHPASTGFGFTHRGFGLRTGAT